MVASTAFVMLFVVLGLGTLLVAMRGGPKGVGSNLGVRSSRHSSSVIAAVAVVSVLLGFGVPALILANNSGAHEKRGPGGVTLTADQAEGRKLFAMNCSTCHTLRGANAVGKVGPNLDELRPVAALTTNAIRLGRARGQGQMPSLLLTGKDADVVASFVAAVAGR